MRSSVIEYSSACERYKALVYNDLKYAVIEKIKNEAHKFKADLHKRVSYTELRF